ncbi:MAG: nuclear transport factor 2 family protein [Bacteroidota bacterium]|nr:nuclear transport factor 2 family protein [Bacteroidota bacterium]
MKKSILLLLLLPLISLQFCTCPEEAGYDPEKDMSAIRTVLEKYTISRENEDILMIEEVWATNENIILIGTDSDEHYVGWDEIRKAVQKQFGSFENVLISITDQKIQTDRDGRTAWFSQTLNYNFIFNGEAMSFEGIRATGVLDKQEGKWKIVQVHLSVPIEVEIDKEMTH